MPYTIALGGLALIYVLPAIVATRAAHCDRRVIVVFNLVLGWTMFGWMIAMIWACTDEPSLSADDTE